MSRLPPLSDIQNMLRRASARRLAAELLAHWLPPHSIPQVDLARGRVTRWEEYSLPPGPDHQPAI